MEHNIVKKSVNVEKMKGQKLKTRATSPLVALSPIPQLSHIPDLHAVRQDSAVQAQFQQRLKQLADCEKTDTKIKSFGGPSAESCQMTLWVCSLWCKQRTCVL